MREGERKRGKERDWDEGELERERVKRGETGDVQEREYEIGRASGRERGSWQM